MKVSTIINTIRTCQTKGLQSAIDGISSGYTNPSYFPIVEDKNGNRYYREYVGDVVGMLDRFSKMPTSDDVVFDVGAFIGGFTIEAARTAKRVYAFEPLYNKELEANISLNRECDGKVRVFDCALGIEDSKEVDYFRTRVVKPLSFKEMVSMTEPPTYLKCNCEGGEWSLKPIDFNGINHFEIQFHYSKTIPRDEQLLVWLRNHYTCKESIRYEKSHDGIYKLLDMGGENSVR